MKNLRKFQWLFLFALVVGLSACGDDDEGPRNQATVDGEKFTFANGYIASEEDVEDDNEVVGSQHAIYLTEKGLTIDDDDNVFEGEGNVTAFIIFSPSDDELEAGTYEIVAANEVGNVTQFVMATEYSYPDPDEAPEFDKSFMGQYGTVKVSRSGETYTFNFTITRYTVAEEGDLAGEDGEGEIKGYFKGKLESIDISDEGARTPAAKLFKK